MVFYIIERQYSRNYYKSLHHSDIDISHKPQKITSFRSIEPGVNSASRNLLRQNISSSNPQEDREATENEIKAMKMYKDIKIYEPLKIHKSQLSLNFNSVNNKKRIPADHNLKTPDMKSQYKSQSRQEKSRNNSGAKPLSRKGEGFIVNPNLERVKSSNDFSTLSFLQKTSSFMSLIESKKSQTPMIHENMDKQEDEGKFLG